jgi:hypothetical protein
MPLPDSGQPISFEDINLELGNSANAELDLQSASVLLGESDAPYGMDELAGLSFNTFTYGMAGVSGFAVADNGTVTAPTNTLGTITSRVYSSGYNSGTNKFPTVSTDTSRTVDVQVQAPATGYGNNNQIVSGSESAVQGALETYTISTWVASGGTVSINRNSGNVSVSGGNSTTTVTVTPTSFSTFTSPSSQQQNVSVGNITVPSFPTLYTNSDSVISGTITVTQLADELPTFAVGDWTGVITIGQDGTISATTGNVSSVNVDTATFYEVTEDTPQTVQFDLIGIPSGYSNSGGNLNNQTQTVTQPAIDAFELSDWTGTISINGQDGTISTTAGNVSSVNIDTGTFTTVDIETPRTVQFDLIGLPSGYSNTGGNLNNQTQTVSQPPVAPNLSITTSPTTWSSNETGVKTLTITNTGGDLESVAQFSLTGLSLFKLVGVDSNVPVINPHTNYYQATATDGSASTFSVGVQPEGNNTNASNNTATVSFLGSNDGGSQTITFTPTQTYPVTWSATPSSFTGADRFDTAGETQYITLSTSESWTASVSGVGFSLDTTSGTAGTHTIGVTATANSGDTRTGTVFLSATGQTDITISLSQLYSMQDLDVSWNSGVIYKEGGDTSTETLSNSNVYREYQIYARQDYDSTVTWQITTGTSYAVWNTGGGTTSTLDQTATVGTTPVSKIIRILGNSSSSDVSSAIQVSSDRSIDLYYKTYTHEGTDDSGDGGGGGGGAGPME